MPIVAFSITKSKPFRDSVQEFTNVYHYNPGSLPNAALADTIIDELVTKEKAFHDTSTTFVRGRCWSAGGSPSSNNMISQKSLSGLGALAPNTTIDAERAYLIYWPAGLDSRGKAVYLRKWYHSGGQIGGVTLLNTILTNATGFTTANRTAIASACDPVRTVGPGGYDLCAESGRPNAGPAIAHKYLEHHQLGDQWRAN